MVKIKLRYVDRFFVKGRLYYRYRRNGLRIPLPNDHQTAEFMEAYKRIHNSFETQDSSKIITQGTIAALVTEYKKSSEFKGLSDRTKELYYAHLDTIQERFGRFPVKSMTRNIVLTFRDSFSNSHGKANNAIKILSRLFSFAIDRDLAKENPVMRIKKLKMGAYRPWSVEEINKFLEAAPSYIRLALLMGLYTGQRESDILKMRWDQIKDDGIELKQQKTGKELWIPLHDLIKAELDKSPKTSSTIISTQTGKPYNRRWFITEWKKISRAAGLPEDCVFHGLRKTASVYLAEAGCTRAQIKAITGHATDSMVAHYTEAANQKTLARSAMKKLQQKPETPTL